MRIKKKLLDQGLECFGVKVVATWADWLVQDGGSLDSR